MGDDFLNLLVPETIQTVSRPVLLCQESIEVPSTAPSVAVPPNSKSVDIQEEGLSPDGTPIVNLIE